MRGMNWSGSVAVTVLRLDVLLARPTPSRRSPASSSGRRRPRSAAPRGSPSTGGPPSHEPGRGVIVASGAGGAAGSTNPGPRVPTAVGFACGRDQSSAEPQPLTSTAVATAAASVPTSRSRARKEIVLGSGERCGFFLPQAAFHGAAPSEPFAHRSPRLPFVHPTSRLRSPTERSLMSARRSDVVAVLVARGRSRGSPLLSAAPAFAHGFSSIVYVDATSPEQRARPRRARAGVRPARRLRRRRREGRPALPGRHRGVRGRRRGEAGGRARRPRRHGPRVRDRALRRHGRGRACTAVAGRRLHDRATRRRPVRACSCSTTAAREPARRTRCAASCSRTPRAMCAAPRRSSPTTST